MKRIKQVKPKKRQMKSNKPARDSEIVISRNGTEYQVAPSGSWHRITRKLSKRQVREREARRLTQLQESKHRLGLDKDNNSDGHKDKEDKGVE